VNTSLACVALLSLSALLVAADLPAKVEPTGDARAIQGTWQSFKEEMRGGPAPGDPRDHQMIFSGENFKLVDGDNVLLRGSFKLDASKTPKVVEMVVSEGAGGDPEAPVHGIYELKGDELKWCAAEPGSKNGPDKFETRGTTNVFLHLKRPASVK
jgi:uncharacterized protein (TIGR03067 family)